jgi:hypothetical protein
MHICINIGSDSTKGGSTVVNWEDKAELKSTRLKHQASVAKLYARDKQTIQERHQEQWLAKGEEHTLQAEQIILQRPQTLSHSSSTRQRGITRTFCLSAAEIFHCRRSAIPPPSEPTQQKARPRSIDDSRLKVLRYGLTDCAASPTPPSERVCSSRSQKRQQGCH